MCVVRLRLLSFVSTGLLVLAIGCGGNNSGNSDGGTVEPCTTGTDFDMDGYGEGCPAGEDCDDFDPTVNTICPDANCSTGIFQGCPCDPAADTAVSCYDGPPETAGNAPCLKGTRSCDPLTSTWSACGGQVLPEQEVCDSSDNDCDGDTDEGVQSACGNCIPGCQDTGVGTDPFPLPTDDPNVGADGVGLDPNGDLVLDSSTFENHFIWPANNGEGTVSKIDSQTGCEIARYSSISTQVIIDHTGGGGATITAGANYSPSRTAVDYHGNVWVANRAFSAQPSATKIMNVIDDCEDRDGNMMIDTSSDVNGDCVIDITDPAEFKGDADECIKMTVVVGGNNALARAAAIDSGIEPGDPGSLWLGMFNEGAFYHIDGRTGALKQRVPTTGSLSYTHPTAGLINIRPYGAAIDSQGRLSAAHRGNNESIIGRINTVPFPSTVEPSVDIGDHNLYGVTVDTNDRVWTATWLTPSVKRYDPATGMTVDVVIPGYDTTWGVRGVGIDTHGNVWASLHQGSPFANGRMIRIDADTAMVTGDYTTDSATQNPEIPVGIGVDFDGDVWTINQSGAFGGSASRLHIDQTSLEPANHATTGNMIDVFQTGGNPAGTGSGAPYTYSDFTGLGLRTVTRPQGDYTVKIQGCADGAAAVWHAVTWDATLPANTSVEIWVRVGDDLATVGSAPIYGPWLVSPADLSMAPGPVPDGVYLELTIRLISEDQETTPIVHAYEVQHSCPNDPIP